MITSSECKEDGCHIIYSDLFTRVIRYRQCGGYGWSHISFKREVGGGLIHPREIVRGSDGHFPHSVVPQVHTDVPTPRGTAYVISLAVLVSLTRVLTQI